MLRERGLTFSTTLNWGIDVNYLRAEANNPDEARKKIEENKTLLERACNITINLEKLYLAPESVH